MKEDFNSNIKKIINEQSFLLNLKIADLFEKFNENCDKNIKKLQIPIIYNSLQMLLYNFSSVIIKGKIQTKDEMIASLKFSLNKIIDYINLDH